MSIYRFSLHEDSIGPGGWIHILTGGANRALICLQGSAGMEDAAPIYKEEAQCTAGATMVTTGHDGALLWRWELAPYEDPEEVDSAGVTSRLLATVNLDLEDGLDYRIRVESLGLPPKDRLLDQPQVGQALCACLRGSFLLTDGEDEEVQHKQAEAWFQGHASLISLKADEEEPSLLLKAVLQSPEQQAAIVAVPVSANENGDEPNRFHKVLAEGFAAL